MIALNEDRHSGKASRDASLPKPTRTLAERAESMGLTVEQLQADPHRCKACGRVFQNAKSPICRHAECSAFRVRTAPRKRPGPPKQEIKASRDVLIQPPSATRSTDSRRAEATIIGMLADLPIEAVRRIVVYASSL